MKEYNCYIDESGDEGIRKGSKYFILTAIIVEKEKDLEVSSTVDKIKENMNMDKKKQLHWNTIKSNKRKNMILDTISTLDIKIINVIIDTQSIKFIPSSDVYNFFSGYLYERICWYMKKVQGQININVSSRGNLTNQKLKDYLKNNNYKKFNIETKFIKDIKVIPNQRRRLLQLADCCTSSLFQALKNCNEKYFNYVLKIKNKIYNENDKILSYGLKIVPSINKAEELKKLIKYFNK